jgi:8-oxo-dGTP diphosphatase
MKAGMSEAPKRNRNEHSAGGAVLALLSGRPQLAMIATRNRSRWGLPKGAVDAGETTEQAALREVLEETGLTAEVVHHLEQIAYFFHVGPTVVHKRVDFFLMAYRSGALKPQLSEVDDVAWVDLEEASRRASFDSERKLIGRIAAEWQSAAERLLELPA